MNARMGACSLLLLNLGCVVWIREPDAYREELVELVEVRDETIATCYDEQLEREQLELEKLERAAQGPYADIGPAIEAQMEHLEGEVVVQFVAAAKTGDIVATIVPESTTAPPQVAQCVVQAVSGLHLEPADEREGRVALSFELRSGKRPSPSAPEPSADD